MIGRISPFVTVATLALVLSTSNSAGAKGRDPHSRIAAQNGWRTNLEVAKREAGMVNKPLLVVLRCFD